MNTKNDGILALEDGSLFWGESVGAPGIFVGEVVFNTSMTGYQEILTDPSYAQQILSFTFPHIGNVGVNEEDKESERIWAGGVVMNELSPLVSNWRAEGDLGGFLQAQKVVAIAGVDTRRLTHILRQKGSQSACIMAGEVDPSFALKKARKGLDLVKKASIEKHVIVLDGGVKRSILQKLELSGCRLTILPLDAPFSAILALKPDGVFLSNGSGDPAACTYAIETVSALLEADIPLFGICLGHQILALACGAKTVKMQSGHHGANHPIVELSSGKVFISSQNHGFVVEEKSLPLSLIVTHRSLFDGTIAGLEHTDKPAFSFQGHPEASPGPHELKGLFTQFIHLMEYGVYAKTH